MSAEPHLLQLIYIHGFQGDHTTFQAFPLDLQGYLSQNVPSGLQVQSAIYPTYKSVKPISHAAKNFLEWLSIQPPGPVILLGHSMGGLLAAEAATDPSNNPEGYPGAKPKRIVGMIAFDCPYLGMHPHVVKTGIASLFPGDDDKKQEQDLNEDPSVSIVDERVTDEWESYKRSLDSDSIKTLNSYHTANSRLSPSLNSLSSRSSSLSPKIDKALSFFSNHSDDPLVRWARKHSDEPFSAGKRWIVDRFQFGSSMFDPSGLKQRYTRLVNWNGVWVNYWTQTPSRPKIKSPQPSERTLKTEEKEQQVSENDLALIESGMTKLSSPSAPSTPSVHSSSSSPASDNRSQSKSEAKAAEKERKTAEKEQKARLKELKKAEEAKLKEEKDKSAVKPGRHFVVLPTGLGQIFGGTEKWENVVIGGVDDEVKAHCGLFIRDQNLDYEGLVERVGQKVLKWCEEM